MRASRFEDGVKIIAVRSQRGFRLFQRHAVSQQDGAFDIAMTELQRLADFGIAPTGKATHHRNSPATELGIGHTHIDHQPAIDMTKTDHECAREQIECRFLCRTCLETGRSCNGFRPSRQQNAQLALAQKSCFGHAAYAHSQSTGFTRSIQAAQL